MKAKVGIVATGALLHKALQVAQKMAEKGIPIKVINMQTIKPLDEEAVITLAKETGKIVTVEEHQIMGGLGSAVAEVLSQNHPTYIEFIGVKDKFGQSGTPEELIEHYGMGTSAIEKAVEILLKK
jgi:transketolase